MKPPLPAAILSKSKDLYFTRSSSLIFEILLNKKCEYIKVKIKIIQMIIKGVVTAAKKRRFLELSWISIYLFSVIFSEVVSENEANIPIITATKKALAEVLRLKSTKL